MTNEEILAYYNTTNPMSSIVNLLNLARIDQNNKLEEYTNLLKEYINLLGYELNDAVGMASIHGWQSTRVEQGKILRAKIELFETIEIALELNQEL